MKRSVIRTVAISLLLSVFTSVCPQEADNASGTLNHKIMALYQQEKYGSAIVLAQQKLETAKQNLGSDHPDIADILTILAELYIAQGAHDKAEPLLKRSLAIKEKALGPDHPDLADRLDNLAKFYKTQGAYDKAEPLYERLLAIKPA